VVQTKTVPAEKPKTTVNVMVSSQPTGAKVFVDGKDTGSSTDSLIWDVEEGEHIFEFRLGGFSPAFLPTVLRGKGIQQLPLVKLLKLSGPSGESATGESVSGESATGVALSETLDGNSSAVADHASTGLLSIVVEPQTADIFIDDKIIEKSPVSIELLSGSYEIVCSAKGYFSKTMTVRIYPGKTETLRVRLERKENAGTLLRLSRTYSDLGNLPLAIESIQKAIDLEPEYSALHQELIALNLRVKEPEKALTAAQRATILFPDNSTITYLHGLALFETSHFIESRVLLEKAVKAEPRQKIRLESLAVCYEELKDWQGALMIADRLIALGDKTGEFYNLRGFCLSKLGRHKEALASFNRAIALSPENIPFKLNAAEATKVLEEKSETVAPDSLK
jgi:Tfp pilus assembly protein PilF